MLDFMRAVFGSYLRRLFIAARGAAYIIFVGPCNLHCMSFSTSIALYNKKISGMKKHPTKFEGYYVTEDGKVYRTPGKTHDSFAHKADADGFIEVASHERGGNIKDGRYLSVNISLRNESGKHLKQIKYYTHRLIAETLIDNPNNYETVNHIDNNKQNNSVSNLEWTTQADNWRKAAPSQRDYYGRWISE